jgi:molybdopterin synthase sulfur carrier subunit
MSDRETIQLEVQGFASAGDALGRERRTVTLPAGATVADLRAHLTAEFPDLSALWPRLAVAVDGDLAQADDPLFTGAEVALLPPVSGG